MTTDIRRMSREDLDELNKLGELYRGLRKPLSLAAAHSSAEPIASDSESMPTAAVQMDLFS
jgi:hypothetical protein